MRNVEIKAKIDHPTDIIARLEDMNISNGTIIKQHDTFFKVSEGRLKLRMFEDGSGELIFYQRSDITGPKLCNYEKTLLDADACAGIHKVLAKSNGCIGVVEKTRNLYMVDSTRVHVDDVKGLGHFMELEVVLGDDQSIETGEKIAQELMSKLGVNSQNLIAEAYIDLLTKAESS